MIKDETVRGLVDDVAASFHEAGADNAFEKARGLTLRGAAIANVGPEPEPVPERPDDDGISIGFDGEHVQERVEVDLPNELVNDRIHQLTGGHPCPGSPMLAIRDTPFSRRFFEGRARHVSREDDPRWRCVAEGRWIFTP